MLLPSATGLPISVPRCSYSTSGTYSHAKRKPPAETAHIGDAHAQLLLEEVGQGLGGLSEGEDALHAAPVPLLGELRQADCKQRLLIAAQVMVRHPNACSPTRQHQTLVGCFAST